jgi:hypothetical protein
VYRGLVLAGLAAAGLASLVGSGGGFPPCEGIYCDNLPLPPTVRLEPDVATVAVGNAPSFSLQVWDANGPVGVQWQRSDNGGLNYTTIAGANASTLTLPPANLANDGVRVRAVVSAPNGSTARADGRVAVSATPSVAFEDGDFLPSNWLMVALPLNNQTDAGSVIDERLASGGNPGAFGRHTVRVSVPAGLSHQLGLWRAAAYDPATQGAIRHIEHHVDCNDLAPTGDTRGTELFAAFEQAGRYYVSNQGVLCRTPNAWRSNTLGGLQAEDFRVAQGAACAVGAACPDFSATGAPIHFGEDRLHLGASGELVVHGTDNWRVSVWRR